MNKIANVVVSKKNLADLGYGEMFRPMDMFVPDVAPNNAFLVPKDPEYRFDNLHAFRILWHSWVREFKRTDSSHRKGVYLHGPTGSGKSSLIEQFFAYMGMPLVRLTWTPKREADDLLAGKTLIDGNLLPVDQGIAMAARNGWPVVIHEIDLADPAELVALNDVIEKGVITTPDGDIFVAKRGFCVYATSNSNGTDDDSGSYHGTNSLNVSTLRRFFSLELDYPSEEAEVAFLEAKLPSVSKDILLGVARVVSVIRNAYVGTLDGKSLSAPISRPETVDWVEMMATFQPLKQKGINVAHYAMGFAYTNRLSKSDVIVVNDIIENHLIKP